MRKVLLLAVFMGILSFLGIKPVSAAEQTGSAYDYSFNKIEGGALPLADFKGKAILVVNTASECGFTSQYEDLQKLYDEYKDKGLVVIGVPSNDFKQEPAENEEIKEFCETKFAITFPLTEKTVVTGDNAHPFYKWAAENLGFGSKPKWNFHKYLINKDGKLVDYFNSTTSPNAARIRQAIDKAIK